MTTPANGYVPVANLASIGNGLLAEKNTAAAFARLRAAHPEVHTNGPASGYWNRDLDIAIHAHPGNYGISAAEAKQLSPAGASLHGLGLRLNFSGCAPDVARQFGFSEFNAYTFTYMGTPSWVSDPSGPGDSALTPDQVKAVAAYLNNRAAILDVPTTTAVSNGIQGPRYWTLVQSAAHDDGLYPTPAYKINGIPGPRTYMMETHYLAIATAPVVINPTPTPPSAPTPVEPPVSGPPASGGNATGTTPPIITPTTPKPTKAPPVKQPTAAEIKADIAELQADSDKLSAGVTSAPLAGLFAGHTKGRKRAYAAYAGAALLVSFGPDLVTYQIITGIHVAALTAWIGFVSSAMLKIGAAFGFVASANTKD